jgi:hypothetical protein
MPSHNRIITELIYHSIQRANSKRMLDSLYKHMKLRKDVKTFTQFQKFIISECFKSIPIIDRYIRSKPMPAKEEPPPETPKNS